MADRINSSCGSLFRIGPEKVLAPDQQAAAHKQQLQIRRRSHPGQADDILVHGSDLRHALFFQRLRNAGHPIPQPGRFFEGFAIGRPLPCPSATRPSNSLSRPSRKQRTCSHDAVIVCLRLVTGTGRHAAFDFKFQTGALGRPVDVDLARRQREHFLDDLQGFS